MKPVYTHALLITGSRTWSSEQAMRSAFNNIWQRWLTDNSVARPVLISGHCPKGADALAEKLWRSQGFDVIEMPADWSAEPRRAGFLRNEAMVDMLLRLAETGTEVAAAAFLDRCARPHCPQSSVQQLLPDRSGHFSHGTVHARQVARDAGVPVFDAIQ